ncbi:MAG: hypothetical protein HC890_04215 [Chloroflexaceae bacterium]|nr:hypothetical protein [Chloroflexaceae bacterium]
MTPLDKLQPANNADVVIYTPYYSKDKHRLLPLALSLYQQGNVQGQRSIEGNENIPFLANWFVSKLPSELTLCRIQFDGQLELSYEATFANSEFVDYLIELLISFERARIPDFPRAFYRKLLRLD